MSVTQGIYDVIIADTGLTNKLAKYKSAPAVFTFTPAPENAASPQITISQVGGIPGNGRDRGHKGGVISADVKVYSDKGDSEKALRNLADELWLLLDRASVQADGFDETVYCFANPPQKLDDPEGFPGFLVTCRVLVRKQA